MIDDDIIINHPVLISHEWYLLEIVRGSECAIADWDTRKSSLEEERYTVEKSLSMKYTFFSTLSLPDTYRQLRSDDKCARRVFKREFFPEGHLRGTYITGIRTRVKDRAPRNSGNSGNPGVSLVIMRVASVSPQLSNLVLGMSPISYDIGAN